MSRASFDRQLADLQDEMLTLGKMVDRAIDQSIQALRNHDNELARRLIGEDLEINSKRFEIEERCLQLIARQQPLAGDLRVLAAILSVITDLERMADHAEGIAKICLMHGEEPLLKPLIDIPRMADKGRHMLEHALESFISRDIELAKATSAEDDEVDALYNQIYHELLTFMIEDPRTIQRATYLIWAAHNLERFADHVTNICERVVFLVTGHMEEFNVSKAARS
jgi:phosphate transport system protein